MTFQNLPTINSEDTKMQKLYFGSPESLLGFVPRFWQPCRRNRLAVYTARWSLASDPDTKRTKKLETDVAWKLTWKVLAFVLSCLTLHWNFSPSFIGFEDCPIQLRQRTEPPHKLHDRTPPLAGPAAFSCRHDSPKTFFVRSLAEDWRYMKI